MFEVTNLVETPFGVAYSVGDTVRVEGDAENFYNWANRLGEEWPCSYLARLEGKLFVEFGRNGDLDDIVFLSDATGMVEDMPEVPVDEFNAWTDDMIFYLENGGSK